MQYYERLSVFPDHTCVEHLLTKATKTADEVRRLNRFYYHPRGVRLCNYCGCVKNASSAEWYLKRHYSNGAVGLSGRCKDCDKKRAKSDKVLVRESPEKYCKRIVASLRHRAKIQNVPFDLTGSWLYTLLLQ